MKAILISIKPKYVADILNGKKTIEIRKTMPKCDLPIDVYIYCTKDKDMLVCGDSPFKEEKEYCISKNNKSLNGSELPIMNGKVVAKFTLNKVEEISKSYDDDEIMSSWRYYENEECLEEQAGLNNGELQDYLDMKDGYAWHISNLVIFDRPRGLGEFRKVMSIDNHWLLCADCPRYWEDESGTPIEPRCELNWKDCDKDRLTKSPQSYCYVEVEE